jgi:Squalene-hopene cyclase C-terminal domain
MFTRRSMISTSLVGASAFLLRQASAQEAKAPTKTAEQIATRAIEFLRTKGQDSNGAFTEQSGPAVTALVLAGVLRNGYGPAEPFVAKSLKYLETFVQPDGGIYEPGSTVQNYETSIGLMAFVAANKDGRYDKVIMKADAFLKNLQWDEAEGKGKEDTYFGGAGYGSHKRPDLSNTSFFIEALMHAGNDAESQAMQRALVFVSRCQNLESEHNTTEFAAKNPDGGFYYTPAAGGNSQAGKTETGGLRSYASMTYAGLKSMIYAGLKKDDKRVKAAMTWLKKNYDLDSNPGMDQQGLFYYYQTIAKCLEAYGEDKFVDAAGKEHDWRAEIIAELSDRQKEDGSFVNPQARWMEGDANLVTGYALLALAHCRPKATK